ARAGGDGIATFSHLEQIDPAIRQHLAVVLDVSARAPIFALVDLDRPPPQPVVLQLPGAGEVRVTLVDASGAPYSPCAPGELRVEAAIDADPPNGRRVALAF